MRVFPGTQVKADSRSAGKMEYDAKVVSTYAAGIGGALAGRGCRIVYY